jgi:hypothetical protein
LDGSSEDLGGNEDEWTSDAVIGYLTLRYVYNPDSREYHVVQFHHQLQKDEYKVHILPRSSITRFT